MHHDFAFIRPDVSYDQVAGNRADDLLPAINEFVMRVSDILNSFATRFQRSIGDVEARLNAAEIYIKLLEQKRTPLQNQSKQLVKADNSNNQKPVTVQEPVASSTTVPVVIEEAAPVEELIPEEDTSNMIKIKDHPHYSKFFKMIRLGIPEAAVVQKMSVEGVDPSLLNNPDRLVAAPIMEEEEDSE